jgi:hypothetical protein
MAHHLVQAHKLKQKETRDLNELLLVGKTDVKVIAADFIENVGAEERGDWLLGATEPAD